MQTGPSEQVSSATPKVTLGSVNSAVSLLELERQIRKADNRQQLAQRLVNDTLKLVAYDRAFLWSADKKKNAVTAVSNLSETTRGTPFAEWASSLCSTVQSDRGNTKGMQPFALEPKSFEPQIAANWAEFLPSEVVCVPIPSDIEERGALLVLARAEKWVDSEKRILSRLAETAGHALDALENAGKRQWLPRRRPASRKWLTGVFVLGLAAMFIPVKLTVLATAEVVPVQPEAIRSPIDAVIQSLEVRANQAVKTGDILIRLDDTEIKTRLEVASREFDIAVAEQTQAQQSLIRDANASSRLSVLQSRRDSAQAEVDYLNTVAARTTIYAERDGIAIIADPDQLIGRPVRIGERIMTVADPRAVRVNAWLAVDDYVSLAEGTITELFLNTGGGANLVGHLTRVDYLTSESVDGVLGYKLVSEFEGGQVLPRIGQRGTLRLSGEEVPLGLYLFRRPWAAIRPWIGF